MKKFKIDYSFVLLLALLSLSPKQDVVVKLFFCLAIHEMGHLFMIFCCRYKIESLKLSIFGFFLKLDHIQEKPLKDLVIFSGGIAANLLCYLIFPDPILRRFNLLFILFNCIPVYPLDGFQICKTIGSYFLPYWYVVRGLGYCSLFLSILSMILALYYRMDLFVIFNLVYLLYLAISYFLNQKKIYYKFMIKRSLYSYDYPIKTISFHTNYQHHIYKYHKVQMKIGNRVIEEKELLETKNFKV